MAVLALARAIQELKRLGKTVQPGDMSTLELQTALQSPEFAIGNAQEKSERGDSYCSATLGESKSEPCPEKLILSFRIETYRN